MGLFMLALLGMCMAPDSPPSSSYPASTSSYSASTYATSPYNSAPAAGTGEWFYIHGVLNVRAEPDKHASIVRRLRRGDFVQLGPKDAKGWARLYTAGSAEGYVYRASDLVRTRAPVTESVSRGLASPGGGSRRSSAASRGYHTGPRGGCYTYSASGRKRYVDHSYCR